MPDSTKSQQPWLLEQGRQVLRLYHYSIHNGRSQVDWIVRFVHFHSMHSREDLFAAEAKIELFLTDHAVLFSSLTASQKSWERRRLAGISLWSAAPRRRFVWRALARVLPATKAAFGKAASSRRTPHSI